MINLLAVEKKDDIRAARSNVIILRYTSIIILAFLFIGAALYTSYSVLTMTMASTENLIATNDGKAEVYSETREQVTALSGTLTEAKARLDQEVHYSKVLVQIGQIMPQGTTLGSLSLSSASFAGTPVDIVAYAKTPAEATQIQSQFQSSPLFSKVDLKGTETDKGIEGYPVSVSMAITFNRTGL